MPANELIEMTKDEWQERGVQLFGENTDKWKFVCPGCGHIQAIEDFRQYKEQGATPNSATIECIGRYSGGRRWLNEKRGQPCDYAGYGLLNICPVKVILEEGKPVYSFAFADGNVHRDKEEPQCIRCAYIGECGSLEDEPCSKRKVVR